MKKVLVLIVLMFVSVSVYAQKPLIKFIDENGNETKYNIEDISEINFIKSDLLYKMFVYKKDTTNTFLTLNIKSMEFVDSNKIKINLLTNSKILYIGDIDSIIFVEDICSDVTIGTQTWTCKNLDVDHYRNGDPIPEVTDPIDWANLKTGAWCYYNNDPALGAIYGKLYNWYAVNDPRGLAPEGWHIPTNNEWILLTEYLGGKNLAGGKLKSIGIIESGSGLWQKSNKGASNESGFSALPGGHRGYSGMFELIGYFGSWWSYAEFDSSQAWLYRVFNNDIASELFNYYKNYGFSVRCIRDDNTEYPKINSVSPNPVSMGDVLTIVGEKFGTSQDTNYVRIYSNKLRQSYYQSWSETEIKIKMPKGFPQSLVSVTINGWKSNDVPFNVDNISNPPKILSISPDSAEIGDVITIKGKNFGEVKDSGYVLINDKKIIKSSYQSWSDSIIKVIMPTEFVKGNISVTVYGSKSDDFIFATRIIEYSTVTDIDGNVYKTVKIGNQWWMAENLKVSRYLNGDTIPVVKDYKEWAKLIAPACCNYNNDQKNREIYGKLYNFYVVEDKRRIAPEGWHIPSDGEWNVLSKYLGGEKKAGAKLKSIDTLENGNGLWTSPNVGATNASGFSAIPGGYRAGEGYFSTIGIAAYWWASSKMSNSLATYLNLRNNSLEFYLSNIKLSTGMSIRCVKD